MVRDKISSPPIRCSRHCVKLCVMGARGILFVIFADLRRFAEHWDELGAKMDIVTSDMRPFREASGVSNVKAFPNSVTQRL